MQNRHILAISGSLREKSFNTALAQAAKKLAPSHLSITVYQRLREIPPYDQDLDTNEPPEPVADLRSQISASDGLLIVTPEHNHSLPGVLKNAIDWASRPPTSSALRGKPVAIAGASPTNFGSVRAQLALRQVLHATECRVLSAPEVIAFRAASRFDTAGNLIDEETKALLTQMLGAFGAHLELCHDSTQKDDVDI